MSFLKWIIDFLLRIIRQIFRPPEEPTEPEEPAEESVEEPAEEPVEEPDDVEILARILHWECRGEPEHGQIACAEVILNRLRDKRWPNTLEGVIMQPNQFTPTAKPGYFDATVGPKQREIAQRAMAGERVLPVSDYYYFSVGAATKYAHDFIKIGGHWFGRDRRDKPLRQTLRLANPRMKGEDVKKLQWALSKQGYDCGPVDGDFGTKTDLSLRAFQKAKGLDIDGVCGVNTWNELDTSANTWAHRLIEWGYAEMIELRGLTWALKSYQCAMAIKPDGVAGTKTLTALNGAIIIPRLSEDIMRCQCPGYCDGYPAGYGMGISVRILAERIFKKAEEKYGPLDCRITTRATPAPNGAIAGGNRCVKWAKERSSTATSRHVTIGGALDIWALKAGVSASAIRKYLEDLAMAMNPYGGVGYGASYIVHIDTDFPAGKRRWKY